MPIYEYKCNSCEKVFTVLSLKVEEDEEVRCPYCQNEDIKKEISAFSSYLSSGCSTNPFG